MIKVWSSAWIFVKADVHQSAHIPGDTRGNLHPQAFERNLKRLASGQEACTNPEQQTFIPHSMGGRSENGTSLVFSSHNIMPKLHMSAARIFKSSGSRWRAEMRKRLISVQVQEACFAYLPGSSTQASTTSRLLGMKTLCQPLRA